MFGIGKSTQLVRASRSTDMYAFAILAWEVLTGQLPFHDCCNDSQLKRALENNVRPDVTAICVDIPKQQDSTSSLSIYRRKFDCQMLGFGSFAKKIFIGVFNSSTVDLSNYDFEKIPHIHFVLLEKSRFYHIHLLPVM
jgi:hypothetical protein